MTENEAIKELKEAINDCTSGEDEYFKEALGMGIVALEEIQRIKTVIDDFALECGGAVSSVLEMSYQLRKYLGIGTIEELQALKEQNADCILKHLTGYCSYNETGCSDCKGKIAIKTALEKAEPKKPRENDGCTCPKCMTFNEVFAKRRNTVKEDVVYCWHCGQAIKLDWS